MNENKKMRPVCGNQLDPAEVERTLEIYEATLLASEAYKVALNGVAAVIRNNVLEYVIQSEKLDRLINRITEIYIKYRK